MLNYETLRIFVYFLNFCGGQSTLNSCIRSTLLCFLFREKQRLAKRKIGWVKNFSFYTFILISILLLL